MNPIWRYVAIGTLAFIGGIFSVYYGLAGAGFILGWIFGLCLLTVRILYLYEAKTDDERTYNDFLEMLGKK